MANTHKRIAATLAALVLGAGGGLACGGEGPDGDESDRQGNDAAERQQETVGKGVVTGGVATESATPPAVTETTGTLPEPDEGTNEENTATTP